MCLGGVLFKIFTDSDDRLDRPIIRVIGENNYLISRFTKGEGNLPWSWQHNQKRIAIASSIIWCSP